MELKRETINGKTVWVEPPGPTECPNGHPLSGNVNIGWTPCTCGGARTNDVGGGHRYFICMTCHAVSYRPPCNDETQQAGHWKR
jgi:hypothetical protein